MDKQTGETTFAIERWMSQTGESVFTGLVVTLGTPWAPVSFVVIQQAVRVVTARAARSSR